MKGRKEERSGMGLGFWRECRRWVWKRVIDREVPLLLKATRK